MYEIMNNPPLLLFLDKQTVLLVCCQVIHIKNPVALFPDRNCTYYNRGR